MHPKNPSPSHSKERPAPRPLPVSSSDGTSTPIIAHDYAHVNGTSQYLYDVRSDISLPPHSAPGTSPGPNLSTPPRDARARRRPSTASCTEERPTLLPSSAPTQEPGLDADAFTRRYEQRPGPAEAATSDAEDAGAGACEPREGGAPAVAADDAVSQCMSAQDKTEVEVEYDWATFIAAYALGRWDPLRTPNQPRSHLQAPTHPRVAAQEQLREQEREHRAESAAGEWTPDTLFESPEISSQEFYTPDSTVASSAIEDNVLEPGPGHQAAPAHAPPASIHLPHPSTSAPPASALSSLAQSSVQPTAARGLADKRAALSMSLPFSHRLRSPFADMRMAGAGAGMLGMTTPGGTLMAVPEMQRSTNLPAAEVTAHAAAIRWAAAGVSVAPLALPSPEHELTDPMRGVTATIPGSHPPDIMVHPEMLPLPASPLAGRKTRLSSFWQGTQDVEEPQRPSLLPTIEASPPGSDEAHEQQHQPPSKSSQGQGQSQSQPKSSHGKKRTSLSALMIGGAPIPPATAPVRHFSADAVDDEDYFGSIASLGLPRPGAPADAAALSHAPAYSTTSRSSTPFVSAQPFPPSSSRASLASDHALPAPDRQASAPPFDTVPATVPALPRRICLTRQTSAPLPASSLYERRLRSARAPSEGSAGRAAKEEQMFQELAFLAPPNPPDELERRRALYKFNIWNTGRDPNFDRIVHLVKLVFNTRIVMISLVDGTEEFFKAESGMDTQNMPRTSSFDAHAILQRDDEPMVILDAQEDWRFAKNPLVTGHPHFRFYAGCPLRTSDGYNIGTLSIIDDSPRREFNPRQRHTLKEFAQIAMRELELWRDKIQLRIRDRIQSSMEEFTRDCLEVDKEVSDGDKAQGLFVGTSMEQVYERAARLVKRTLDVEGAIVLDVSHVDVLDSTNTESAISITLHDADARTGTATKALGREEQARLAEFFVKNPDGKICEGIVPATLRPFLPTRIQYALTVPIFNIDKRPFALLCAYSTGERTTPYLEGHELSYLRAIGVIILSAVLKRRMILADKAKSLFISNISHELRTPLHGILASAELLSETSLDHSQASFLQTVQACGTSLVETVNHVLDFTKLSGNARAGGVENIIQLSKVDLMQLVEEATEGCWIGHRARMFTSEIGSVYSPPKSDRPPVVLPNTSKYVETVIDVGHSEGGWAFRCEKGGIRRVLMNLFGNSLKFTTDGYVHVMLRQLPPTSDTPRDKVKIELSVIDTGKGISQHFLKNQLFHPFSQENPLQTGTGLGLAIVNSIVRSSSVGGKVDVWSAEGVGTEIKVTFTAERVEDDEAATSDAELMKTYDNLKRPKVALVGFDDPHRGVQLLRDVLSTYLASRCGLDIANEPGNGEILIVNEDLTPVAHAIESKDARRPFIILSSARGDPRLMGIVGDYERIGGFCRIIYKPAGPCRVFAAIKLCLHALNIGQSGRAKASMLSPHLTTDPVEANFPPAPGDGASFYSTLPRRYSEENAARRGPPVRPGLGPRAMTAHPTGSWSHMAPTAEQDEPEPEPPDSIPSSQSNPASPTISVGSGGTLLRSSVGTVEMKGPLRVLVIEDNSILRNLLAKWLKNKKGYDFREAVDGLEGVRVFESEGHFDVVLVDLSMPVLDGVGATTRMRCIESARNQDRSTSEKDFARAARILALTGMSSLEDKRRAFEAGVDGYLVKPVAFKTLDTMFHKLGIAS
ncbi:histidine kinase [Gelatoporia subvermispora B]|uniref:histidine kinase n=1 Tax=Ceriporiopsis subvermispora (strain B) TaxID=914234 RepID=M2QPI6_CERS8|nr:histidine kinase [Gelatoporia subvermispora B]